MDGFGLQRKPGKASYPQYTPVDNNRGWHDEWFYIRNPSSREEAFPVYTRNAPEKRESWTWGASRRQKNHVEVIEEVLKGLVARGLDGARVFATIFLRKVRVLSALREKMWDYKHDEPRDELQDPSSSGLWRWLDGMIMWEGRRPIGGPSPFGRGRPPT